MAFPNVTDIVATTIQSRTKQIADNVTKNNAILSRLSQRGKIKTFSGGELIYQELSFAENGNAGFYSGYDILPIAAQDVLSAAQYDIRQAACAVTVSGLEQLQNAGKERMIDLLDERVTVAEATMANLISSELYSDSTTQSGKGIDGLGAAIPLVNSTGTYGGINRATWTFWRPYVKDSTSAAALLTDMNDVWSNTVRGRDQVDLIMCDNVAWAAYVALLQAEQRFTQAEVGEFGFPSIKFMGGTDVVMDGGIGGYCPAGTMFFLNCNYLHYRPHAQRNMVPLSPNKRYSINQDAEVQLIGWAGNLTCSGQQFQGRLDINA